MNRRDLLIFGGATAATLVAGWAGATPPTVASAWLSRWLAAFNDPDLQVYRRFIEAHAPTLVPYLDDDLSMREVTGGFELLSVEAASENGITALVRDRAWERRSKVTLTAAGPDKLDDIAFAGASAAQGALRLRETVAREVIGAKLAAAAKAGRFSGALLVARGERPRLSATGGLSDTSEAVPNGTATRFCIGSMGKLFTAVAVMQLVERGRLALSDTLAAHVPDFANRALAERVTVEMLLTHTGGTGDIFGPDYDAGRVRGVDDAVRLFGGREPAFEPGARWGYSNLGFVLLGAIVERVTKRPYESVFQERIFDAAGMTATSQAFASDRLTALPITGARATGLRALKPWEGLPAGGGYSTVEDLHAFVVGLQDETLLRRETLAAMTRPRVKAGARHWGLGVAIGERNGLAYWGHAGAAPGVSGDLAVYPGYSAIVLCNRGHPAAAVVAEYVGARLPKS